MGLEIRGVTAADRDNVSRTLALAFEDDPVKLHVTGGRRLPAAKVMPFFDGALPPEGDRGVSIFPRNLGENRHTLSARDRR